MVAVQGVLRSERWLDECIIVGTRVDVNGAVNDTLALPVGFGDCALMELIIDGNDIATKIASDVESGAFVAVMGADAATLVDIVGVFPWFQTHTARMSCYVSPDPLVLWRQGEFLNITFEELDTNVSPTLDLVYLAKVVRVMQRQGPPGPVQLVRTLGGSTGQIHPD